MRRLAMSCGLALLMTAGAAAQDEGLFDLWDEDESGILTQEEFTAGLDEEGLFGEWNEDENEWLSEDEFFTGLFGLWDDDNNGQLSVAEWDQGIDSWVGEQAVDLEFSAWDEDGDNALAREEFREEMADLGLYGEFDADANQQLAQAEFDEGLFDFADENNDEALNDDEFLFDDFLI